MINPKELLARLDELPKKHRAALTTALNNWHQAKQLEQSKSDFLGFA